ncbi:MAG: helix-turn-helix transcriptional regulator [Lachnospiraceae bacterium]|nr:helix-turn-helix transcriptional regulator [Lachnospiraceae bacterium]
MKKITLGTMIATLRKEQGMTQLELAEKMGVTDKAVSKWERDLSCPDVNSLPKLAEIFGVTVDELMQVKREARENIGSQGVVDMITLVCKAIPLAMGVSVAVLSILKEIDLYSALIMLGTGMACIGMVLLRNKE